MKSVPAEKRIDFRGMSFAEILDCEPSDERAAAIGRWYRDNGNPYGDQSAMPHLLGGGDTR